jgi:hypothetical protein
VISKSARSRKDREHGSGAHQETKVDPANLPGPTTLDESGSGGELGDLLGRRHPEDTRLTTARMPPSHNRQLVIL